MIQEEPPEIREVIVIKVAGGIAIAELLIEPEEPSRRFLRRMEILLTSIPWLKNCALVTLPSKPEVPVRLLPKMRKSSNRIWRI